MALANTTDISRYPGPDPASLNPRSTYQTIGNSNSLIINHRILLPKKKVLFLPTTLHQIAGRSPQIRHSVLDKESPEPLAHPEKLP